jgi:hypothetical protein
MTMTTDRVTDRYRSVPQDRPPDSPALRLTLVGLMVFVGLGGVFGGINMLADPYEAMGMTTHMIHRTPFDTFAVPGVLLLALVGVAPLALAVAYLGRTHPHPVWAAAFGVGLMAWITTQWLLIDERLWLQPLIFAVGAAILTVAAALWWRESRPGRRTP